MKSFFYILFLLFITACSSDDSTIEADQKRIDDLENEITTLVDSATCNENSQCAYIAFGSKPCGGPWSYLVYPTSIDIDLLKSKVKEFNILQREFNIKYGIASDCLFVSPPIELICEDGKCVGVNASVTN